MEPTFKEGEKVRVRQRKYDHDDYKYMFSDDMLQFQGMIVTICTVYPNMDNKEYRVPDDDALYRIKEDKYGFSWSSGMLEKLNSTEEQNPIKKKIIKILYASLEEEGFKFP